MAADAYTYDYGIVSFEEVDGTPIFSTDELGLWTASDKEPSPDVKWVRVDVPGADGSVDLSRALAGQVTYDMREIELQFTGQMADHDAALALVHRMRRALHGARVRIETLLTRRIGGWYVADCECDGTADAGGGVTVDVKAWADPFIRIGSTSLALPATSATTEGPAPNLVPSDAFSRGAGSIVATFPSGVSNPQGATSAHLWWATGANLLDVGRETVRAFKGDGTTTSVPQAVEASVTGQTITLGAIGTADYVDVDIMSSARLGASIDNSGIPFASCHGTDWPGAFYLAVFLSGRVDEVSSPSVEIRYVIRATTDAQGVPSGTSSGASSTAGATVTVGDHADELVAFGMVRHTSASVFEAMQSIGVGLHGIAGTGLSLRFMLVTSSVVPETWEAADLACATIDFGGSWCSRGSTSDEATISPLGVTTTHRLAETGSPRLPATLSDPYETDGTVSGWPPVGATAMCLSAVNRFGEECGSNVITTTTHAIGTVAGANQTMRSTPTVTSQSGALVSIDGRTTVAPGGTVLLDALTIPGGEFEVEYATFGGDATLSWEGGAL